MYVIRSRLANTVFWEIELSYITSLRSRIACGGLFSLLDSCSCRWKLELGIPGKKYEHWKSRPIS